jgi:hypothetical protein
VVLSGPSGKRRRLALLLAPCCQVLLAHQRRDTVLADLPTGIAQVGSDPRRPVLAVMQPEQAPDLGLKPVPARTLRGGG